MMTYFAGMLVSLLTFAFLVARDVGQLTGNRVSKGFYDKSARSEKADLYEEAEQLWADGAFIECIDKLREYTARYPGEYHAHKRIAEVYETDLASYRAAAMEYEEILQMDLPPKRWGWAAIHLCNLYSGKLGETEKALELLRRVAESAPTRRPARRRATAWPRSTPSSPRSTSAWPSATVWLRLVRSRGFLFRRFHRGCWLGFRRAKFFPRLGSRCQQQRLADSERGIHATSNGD